MKAQRRKQANNPFGYSNRHLSEGALCGNVPSRQTIDSPPETLKFPTPNRPGQRDTGNAMCLQIAGADKAAGFGEID